MKLKAILSVALLSVFLGCQHSDTDSIEFTGTVVDAGTANNGCGWLIESNGALFKPNYLSRPYESHGLTVLVKAVFLDSNAGCGNSNPPPSLIRIEQIRPLN